MAIVHQIDTNSIPHAVTLISDWLNEEIRIGLKELGHSDIMPSYAPCLRILELNGGELSTSRLAEKSYRSKPYVTHMVNVLEKNGYIVRVSDEADKRIILIRLTEKGYATQEEIKRLIERIVGKNFSHFSAEELEILAILLNKLSHMY